MNSGEERAGLCVNNLNSPRTNLPGTWGRRVINSAQLNPTVHFPEMVPARLYVTAGTVQSRHTKAVLSLKPQVPNHCRVWGHRAGRFTGGKSEVHRGEVTHLRSPGRSLDADPGLLCPRPLQAISHASTPHSVLCLPRELGSGVTYRQITSVREKAAEVNRREGRRWRGHGQG